MPYKFAKRITHLIAQGTQVNGETYDPAEFERSGRTRIHQPEDDAGV
jgi:hypothetical protein